MDAMAGTDPFIMMADGKGWLFSPAGLLDGPMPTHYEPFESPVTNLLYPEIGCNPATLTWNRPDNPVNPTGDPRYPIVATTFRLTEHHTAGGMSRNLPWLAELQPEMFAEIDPVLAADRGIEDGGWLVIETERAEIEARARVTERMRPINVEGRRVHQIGLPWHWGFGGPSPGDSANDLGVLAADPNVSIQEDKAFTCNVRAGRRTRESTAKLSGVHAQSHASPSHDAPSEDTAHS
jgi:formate dehydrogenase major subunit